MRVLCLAAIVSLLGLTARAQQFRHSSRSVASWSQQRQHHRDAESSHEPLPKPGDGVILNAFPDLTPRGTGSPEGPQPANPAPAPTRRPTRRGLPTPQWRRNPLMPLTGKTTEA